MKINFDYFKLHFCIIFLIINHGYPALSAIPGIDKNIHELIPGIEKLLLTPGHNRLEIFCYSGEPCRIVTLLKTVELIVKVPNNDFFYYEGNNSTYVQQQHDAQTWFAFSPWKPNSFKLNIYNYSCIGIETKETFQAYLNVRFVDIWRVVTLVTGISLFLTAPLLAQNVIFHYMTGVSIGIFGSLLVIVFYISKFVPKKTGALTFLVGGWGLILYFIQYLWSNCVSLLKEYQAIAVGYVSVIGLVSFVLVYRFGPLKDERSLRLVQWSLQTVGLALIFLSSQCKEFTLAIALICIANYNIPLSWKLKVKSFWLRYFPPKQRLLSEEEFLDQTREETKNALEELRKFCHSPDCNAWKTMSVLESPKRFAEFVGGSFHLNDDEILAYESEESLRGSEEDFMTSDDDIEERQTNLSY